MNFLFYDSMDNNTEVVYLYLDDIIPNRFQPREVFDEQALKELAVSIKEHGVIQPIIVRKVDNKYEIIAGERRYKASTMAGLNKIPAIVKNYDDKESSKVALIENLQRRDLTPIEEARTYQKILELEDDMTQEELAATMGKTQSSVSNKLRLLALPDEIQDALLKEKISERHASSLLNIEDKNEQIKMMEKVIAEKMTVRELDKEIKLLKGEEVEEETTPSVEATTEATTDAPSVENKIEDLINVSNVEVPTTEATTEAEGSSLSASDLLNDVNEETTEAPAEEKKDDKAVFDAFAAIKKNLDERKTEVAEKEEDNSTEINTGFKFVPTFGMNSIGGGSIGPSPVEEESNNVASSITDETITITNTKDVNNAVTDIKSAVDKLKLDGYDIALEESDDDSNYKIIINIKKDA